MTAAEDGWGAAAVIFQQVQARDIHVGDKIIHHMMEKPPLWHNVPALPTHFLGRDTLVDDLVQRLIAGQTTALSALGLLGVGKTALAVVLAHHPDVLRHFADGVLWAGLGPQGDVFSALASWGDALEVDVSGKPTPALRGQAVRNTIGQQPPDDTLEAGRWNLKKCIAR